MSVNSELDLEPKPSRYVIGIDLGTTNSATAFVDTAKRPWDVAIFSIPQVVSPGQIEHREILPSFHYQPPEAEVSAEERCIQLNPSPPAHPLESLRRRSYRSRGRA